MRMMPPYLPWHLFLMYLSGFVEIALGVLLLIPRMERLAAWGLIALLGAIFPANIHMAVHAELFPEFSSSMLWARLPMQAVLIGGHIGMRGMIYARGDTFFTARHVERIGLDDVEILKIAC